MKFKIKSNWYENQIMYHIKPEGFYIYIKLRMLEQVGIENKIVLSINYLYKIISTNLKITKVDIKDYLKLMKEVKIIIYNRIPSSGNELFEIDLLDLPITERKDNKDIPISNEDNYLMIDSELTDYMMSKKFTIDEWSVFMCLKKYSNTEQITLGCATIEEYVNINKDKVNKILHKLNKLKLIEYRFTLSQRNRKCNNITLLCNTLEEMKQII